MPSIDRVLRVLHAVGADHGGTTIKELAETLELPTSTVHRILQELHGHDLVTQEERTRRYALGPEILALANRYLQGQDVVSTSQPVLRQLREVTGETAFLTTLIGDRAVCVAIAESPQPLRLFIAVGQEMPYHAAAAARTILAHLPSDRARELLERSEPFPRYTPATPATTDAVMALLETTRTDGVAICRQELDEQVTAVSSPVFGSTDTVVGSITLVAPEHRLTDHTLADEIARVQDSAASVSLALGHVGARP